MTAGFSTAHVKSWGTTKINDALYLKNFKGISDIGVDAKINMGFQ